MFGILFHHRLHCEVFYELLHEMQSPEFSRSD
jgi:hypothetical protein